MIQQQIYEIFVQFEEHSADLFLELSNRFVQNRKLSWFWVEMAMEEKEHAGLLQYCRNAGTLCLQPPTDEEIQHLAGLFKQLTARVQSPTLTVSEAFDIAGLLESSEINHIYRNLTANMAGPIYLMRKKIELSAPNHFSKLRKAAGEFGASPETVHRLSDLEGAEISSVR